MIHPHESLLDDSWIDGMRYVELPRYVGMAHGAPRLTRCGPPGYLFCVKCSIQKTCQVMWVVKY